MSTGIGLSRKKHQVETSDEGLVLIPFQVQVVSGAPDSTTLRGDDIASVADTDTGKITFTLRQKPAFVFGGFVGQGETADNVDLYGQLDWSTVVSAGTFVAKFKTGASNTDVGSTKYVSGCLIVKKTTRRARG